MRNQSIHENKTKNVRPIDDMVFRVALDNELDAVLKLRAELYANDFGHNPDDRHDRIGRHLIALTGAGDIVAGVRILGPGLRPFDFEHMHDLSSIVEQGRRPAMIGRLFLRKDCRAVDRSAYVLLGLLKCSLTFAEYHHITDYYMYTFSHLLRFYRHAGFQSLGITVYHEQWRILHLMHMDMSNDIQVLES